MTLLFAAACGSSYSNGADAGDPNGAAGSSGGGTTGAGGGGGSVTGGGVGGAEWLALPAMPSAIVAPDGATVKAHTHAVGSQIYTCTASGDGADAGATTYAWVLKAPEARLYDSTGTQVGTHGAGPSWTSNDGSTAIGAKVAQADSPEAGAIPWVLLRVSSTSGTGVFSDVTFVHRLNTAGGVAPATGCDSTTAGTDSPIGYSADYYFYTGGASEPATGG